VLNGAPLQTFDIDLVYAREAENIARIMAFLESVDVIYRMQPERRLRPNESQVAAGGHLNLLTNFGPLDLLGTIGQNLGFDELLPRSQQMEIRQGLTVHVLDLENDHPGEGATSFAEGYCGASYTAPYIERATEKRKWLV